MMFDSRNDGARVRAKLTDFGIAVMMEAPLADDGNCVGTAAYLSPEQVKGESLGPPSDVYSLGLVLLECLTGVVSYPGEALPSALGDCSVPRTSPQGSISNGFGCSRR